jgi:glycosyltransferase involved in cell wall biosynthesis
MRILHVTTFLQGGAGRIIVELASEQQQLGHDVTVVASRRGAPGYGNRAEYLDRLSSLGIPAKLVNSTFERSRPRMVAAVSAIDRLLAADDPDVIHAHAAVPSRIALRLAGLRQRPIGVLQTMHGWGSPETVERIAPDVALLNLVDGVAVPSSHSATLLVHLGVQPGQITIVPYGVSAPAPGLSEADDATWIAMTRARRAGRPVMVSMGTLDPRHYLSLIEALAQLDQLNPLCVFVGDGDDRQLRQTIERYGCETRVRVHGPSRSARALAVAADLLVLPAPAEGQPLSILEAFCDGLLVATSDIPELAELVDDGVTGFRFRRDDALSLANTLTRAAFLSNSDRRTIRVAAREQYSATFTLTRMVERYGQLYANLRGQRPEPKRRIARSAA